MAGERGRGMLSRFFSRLLLTLIKGYQSFISPVLPARCRYYPTCSEYGKTAVLWHGPARGGWLALKRICSCHPLGGHGIDFVPLPLHKFVFTLVNREDRSCLFVSRETMIVERGVYKDQTSYVAYLNRQLNR